MGYVQVAAGKLSDLVASPGSVDQHFAQGEQGVLTIDWALPANAPSQLVGAIDRLAGQFGGTHDGGATHFPVERHSPLLVAGLVAGLVVVLGVGVALLLGWNPLFTLTKLVHDAAGSPTTVFLLALGAVILVQELGR
jgi:hypothetical protein